MGSGSIDFRDQGKPSDGTDVTIQLKLTALISASVRPLCDSLDSVGESVDWDSNTGNLLAGGVESCTGLLDLRGCTLLFQWGPNDIFYGLPYLLTRVWDLIFKTRCKYVLVSSTAASMPPTVLKKTSHTRPYRGGCVVTPAYLLLFIVS
jgi:hypothetical protein